MRISQAQAQAPHKKQEGKEPGASALFFPLKNIALEA